MINLKNFFKVILKNLYCKNDEDGLIAPGAPRFIITEDDNKIETEDGYYLITED